MAITQEWLTNAEQALREACPLTINDQKSVEELKAKVMAYDKEIGQAPTVDWVIRMAIPFEQALLVKKEGAESTVRQKQERIAARKKEREYDRLPASAIRAQAVDELRQRNAPVETERFTPEREFTQAEIDKMSDAEVKQRLFGIDNSGINESKPNVEARRLQEQKLLKTKRSDDTPLKRALRRQIREGLL